MAEEVKPEVRVKDWWTLAHGDGCSAVAINPNRRQVGEVNDFAFTDGVRYGRGHVVMFGSNRGVTLVVEATPEGVRATEFTNWHEGWYQFRLRVVCMDDEPAMHGPRLALMCSHTDGKWRDV